MERIKTVMKDYLVYKKAGIELNLVTLKINDEEVMEDYNKEKISKQNFPIMWVNMFIHFFNNMFNYIDYLNGGVMSTFQIIRCGASYTTAVLFAVCYFKWPKMSRPVFVLGHLSFSLITLFGAKSQPGDVLYSQIPISQQIYNDTVAFLMELILLQYCEFYICLLFHFPFYILIQFLLSREAQLFMAALRSSPVLNFTPLQQKFLNANPIFLDLKNALLFSLIVLTAKYLQQLDVC
jgi:hypothetical protein